MGWIRRAVKQGKQVAAFLRPMNIPLHSAYTGFFFVLSLFPGLMLLLGLLRYTAMGPEELLSILEGWVPEHVVDIVRSLVETSYRHSSGTVVSISVVAALYSASRGMFGILGGLHAVYGITLRRNYWRKRVISMGYTAAFLALLMLTLMIHVGSTALLDYLQMTTSPALLFLMRLVDFRSVLLLLLLVSLFTAMYAWLPARRSRLRSNLPGAAAAAIGWLLFTRLFSVYVEYFTTYSNIYGSVYALALGMLWLYFCISIFFYGGALNRLLSQRQTQ